MSEDPDLVWYASYGSNLCYERFICYLEGGKAPGSKRKQRGARDASEPSDERAVFIPHALYFSQHSRSWGGGGVAFIDPRRDDAIQTWGRAYLVTREQFEDIFAQENGTPVEVLDWESLLEQGQLSNGDRWYHHILKIGDLEDKPILTFTNSTNPEERGYNPPSDAYLQTIVTGIFETYHMGKEGTKKYFRDVPGIKNKIKPGRIVKMWEEAMSADQVIPPESLEDYADYALEDDDESSDGTLDN